VSRKKCPSCGLINAATDTTCRRCGAPLNGEELSEGSEVEEPAERRGIGRRLIWIAGTTVLLLFIFYMSLLLTSGDLDYEQNQSVNRAIALLEEKGFGSRAFVLRRLVRYRSSDSWWNQSVGHHDAYAATNFPFEVLTLYPEFFLVAVDDKERAAILLHESYHLLGSGEETALEQVWRDKQRLGWTADKYGKTKVWINTRELTMAQVPNLFICGTEGKSDCTQ
jgi:hypothetical protein